MPLLSVDALVAYRRGAALFSPTSFDLDLGDSAIIRGDNGVGKTTLLECIAGLYRDWTGAIRGDLRGQISYLQQAPQGIRTLSLSDAARLVVGFAVGPYTELVEKLKLESHTDKLLSILSGGELQRARLLLALLRRHRILLLDEPFANLDHESRDAITGVLDSTAPFRATLVVTHTLDAHGILPNGSIDIALCRNQC